MLRASTPLIALAMLVLASCASGPSGSGSSSQTDTPSAAGPTAVARAAPPARTAPTRPRAQLADLMGADAPGIERFLGAPDIVRQEGLGELRLYRSATCILHVFLYPQDGRLTATHIEARSETARLDDRQLNRCLTSFS